MPAAHRVRVFVHIHSFHKGVLVESISEIHTDAPADERAEAPDAVDGVETITDTAAEAAHAEAPAEAPPRRRSPRPRPRPRPQAAAEPEADAGR